MRVAVWIMLVVGISLGCIGLDTSTAQATSLPPVYLSLHFECRFSNMQRVYTYTLQSIRCTHMSVTSTQPTVIVLYSSIYIAPHNSHGQTEAFLVRLAPRKETSFKK